MPRRNKTPTQAKRLQSTGGCGDKKRYPSKSQAEAVIADRMRLIDDGVELTVYRCPNCNGWHLTSVKLP